MVVARALFCVLRGFVVSAHCHGRGSRNVDDGAVQVFAAHGAVELGVAIGKHATILGCQPITTAWRRGCGCGAGAGCGCGAWRGGCGCGAWRRGGCCGAGAGRGGGWWCGDFCTEVGNSIGGVIDRSGVVCCACVPGGSARIVYCGIGVLIHARAATTWVTRSNRAVVCHYGAKSFVGGRVLPSLRIRRDAGASSRVVFVVCASLNVADLVTEREIARRAIVCHNAEGIGFKGRGE